MRKVMAIVLVMITLAPSVTFAFPFGGRIGIVAPCYNNAIYAALGPPRGGPYIWSPATRTYRFGPPRAVGQWLLGLASAPYYCVVSIFPVIVWPGTHIDMMGSSGPAAPLAPPTIFETPSTTPSTDGTPFNAQEYCRRSVEQQNIAFTVDPCEQLTRDLTCDQVRAAGYLGIDRCGT